MSENVLATVDDENLAVHVVWTPVLKTDNYDEAVRAHTLVPDPRVTFYWDADQDLGLAYGRDIKLPRQRKLAWDIYFVYDPDVVWDDTVPLPTVWSHQLGDDERSLGDASRIGEAIKKLLLETK